MLKNTLKISAALLCLATTHATANMRFYGSLGAGLHVRQDSFQSHFTLTGTDTIKENQKIKKIGFVSEYALGLQKQFESWGFASEIFFNYNNSERTQRLNDVRFTPGAFGNRHSPTIRTNQKNSFGLRGLIQAPVSTSWTLMAGADLLWTHFDIDLNTSASIGAAASNLSGHKKEYTLGIAPTIGAEYKLSDTFALRGTYAYQIHRRIKINDLAQTSEPVAGNANLYNYKMTLKPRAHVLKANLVVYF